MKCENCEYMLEEDSLFCPECGSEVKKEVEQESNETIFCMYCGEKLDADVQFCNYCGKSMKEKDENPVKIEPDSIKKTTSRTKKFVGGIVLVVTVLIIIVFAKGVFSGINCQV